MEFPIISIFNEPLEYYSLYFINNGKMTYSLASQRRIVYKTGPGDCNIIWVTRNGVDRFLVFVNVPFYDLVNI